MKTLPKTERTLLADNFLQLAQLVGEYRLKYYHELSPRMRTRIRSYHKSLIDYSDFFYASSSSLLIANSTTSIQKLTSSIKVLKKQIKKIQKTQKIIDSIGAATRLGASIISKQPLAVIASLNEFVNTIEKITQN